MELCVPPGFRFHPTEEELVGYYLARKVYFQKIDLEVITDVDLYRIEPWDLQDRCKLGYEEQKEWYFFSHKDKKYPTGTRTNRATAAGFWKATGKDKPVLSKTRVIGMRKTLVFYVGRAPNGRKSDWIMHEYRLQSSEYETPQEEGWVVCRAFIKQIPSMQRPYFNTCINPGYYIRNHEHFGSEGEHSNGSRTHFMDTSYLGSALHQHQFGDTEGELESKETLNHACFASDVMIPNKEFDNKRNNYGEQFVDWKIVDKVLPLQTNDLASCSSPKAPMVPLDCDADALDPNNYLASFDS